MPAVNFQLTARASPDTSACISPKQNIKRILNSAREQHTKAVQDRIDSVEQQKDVTSHTQALFALARVRIHAAARQLLPFSTMGTDTEVLVFSLPLCHSPSPTHSQETARNESIAFELKQRTELASEVKAVLDSWVRYEGQQREEEQRQLAKAVIDKVTASLRDDKIQKQILDEAVAEIESLVKSKAI